MDNFDKILLQAQANTALLLCFIAAIGFVVCTIGLIFFKFLDENLGPKNYYKILMRVCMGLAWVVLIICVVAFIYSALGIKGMIW